MTRLKKVSLIGALLVAAVVLASASDAQASPRHRGAYRASQYKVYHFTGHLHSNYVTPPYRFRKKIVSSGSYQPGHIW